MQYKILGYDVAGIAIDSRCVKKDYAFFAMAGSVSNGNLFIDSAIDSGARVIFSDDEKYKKPTIISHDIPIIYLNDIHTELNNALDIIFPNVPEYMLSVTGTNGKSSVVHYVREILGAMGHKVASLGTLGINTANLSSDANRKLNKLTEGIDNTTYSPILFRNILHELVSQGVNYVIFEASSHGLVQGRISNVKVHTAAFTNFTQDHLDYHHTMDAYLDAKLKLFENHIKYNKNIVLSADLLKIDRVRDFIIRNKIFFDVIENADNKIIQENCESELKQYLNNHIRFISRHISVKQEIEFKINDVENYKFRTNILTVTQASNLLFAIEMLNNIGIKYDDSLKVLHKINQINGRAECLTPKFVPFNIFIDYAHTPDALANILTDLRQIFCLDRKNHGRLIIIFGCGGDRDKQKRPIMGQIAAKLSDVVIVTDDNPRNEDPANIRNDILKSISNHSDTCHTNSVIYEISDRKSAIIETISNLKRDDILLIAGKGHEKYQLIKEDRLSFDEKNIVLDALRKRIAI